ncbi:LacI family DNA-binding transcriptional regulator [Streptococcus porci]|uniref:LacI family DNA-binding transcriptional regulator n=1 Tax=Streptococcus porci TaxID=502567 RepID=UPI0003FB9272|nr:LacI family DNA-binding transcriptional regulator [Streptococcus porci]
MIATKKSVTMKDVAKLAGVSVGTVSRVINGESGIKELTLSKVNAAIQELNYIPDAYARGMKKNRTETVALIIPTIWHPFFGELAFHVEKFLSEKNYKMFLCNTDGTKKDIEYITMLKQNRVDGIIAITYNPIDDYLASNIPFVSIDRSYSDKNIICITSDNKKGGRLAAEKLLEKGCQHLAFIGSHNETINETKNRRRFFEKAVRESGRPCYILDLEEPFDHFEEQLDDFLDSYPEIDGIFTVNDFTAMDTMTVLQRRGKRIPEDIQIIGYDGIRYASNKPYPLSTIKQPLPEMAQVAVDILLAIIEKQPHDQETILPISYIEGATTKKFKKKNNNA